MIVLKLFVFILPALIILVGITLFMNWNVIKQFSDLFGQKREFKSAPGQTYKLCGYCQKKADRHALTCDFCGRAFE